MSRTINISDETWEKIKDQVSGEDESWEVDDMDDFVGKKLFIRTVTYHLTGEVDKVVYFRNSTFFHLKKAAWIADSGRFMDTIKKGELSEVEPVGEAWVNVNSITDMFPWKHRLPDEQK